MIDAGIDPWVYTVATGAVLLAWMEKRFLPRKESELMFEQRKKSQHDLADRFNTCTLSHAASDMKQREAFDAMKEDLAAVKENQRWVLATLSAIAKKMGVNGIPEPPEGI